MFALFTDRPGMMKEAKKAKIKPYSMLHIIIMIVLFFLAQTAGGILAASGMFFTTGSLDNEGIFTMFSLYGTIFTTILCILFCLLVEHRSRNSMGFTKKGAVK